MTVVRVAVRDRRRLVREGLCLLLNDEADIDAHEFIDGEANLCDVILTAEDGKFDTVALPEARVVVFHDTSTIDEILATVSIDARPPSFDPSSNKPASLPSTPAPMLTPREAEILRRIASGLSATEVSDELGISRKTVEGHKRRIFTKLDVQNQAHAVAIATRAGMLERQR